MWPDLTRLTAILKPEAKRNWCYINGGADCPGAKKSKDSEGMFWKRCMVEDNVAPTTAVEDNCKCQSSWKWKKKAYKGCDPAHPDAERPWCYVTGGAECADAKPSKDVEGAFWKRCTLSDEAPGTPVKPGVPAVVAEKKKPEISAPAQNAAAPGDIPGGKDCKCKVSWVWKKNTYKGCDPGHPEAKRNWCYINGGLECDGAKKSKDVGGMFWKRCTAADEVAGTPPAKDDSDPNSGVPATSDCKCQSSWTWKKKTYKACDPSHPDAERPWCYINGGAKCPGAKVSKDVKNMYWKRCILADVVDGTPVNPNTPLTPPEKKGDSKLLSDPKTANVQVAHGGPCECEDQWTWKKQKYSACDPAMPDSKHTWCYVKGPCANSRPSTRAPDKNWAYCAPCDCKASWEYEGKTYQGCDSEIDEKNPWCAVAGGAKCKEATAISAKVFKKECSRCDCQSAWMFGKKTYLGCDNNAPGDSKPWCYVTGGDMCASAQEPSGERKARWRYCGSAQVSPFVHPLQEGDGPTTPKAGDALSEGTMKDKVPADKDCKCKVSWVFEKKTYKGCDPAHPDAERNWCYINGGASCEGAKESKDVKGMFWKRCTLADVAPNTPGVSSKDTDPADAGIPAESMCKCQSSWVFEKKTYKGCDPSHPDAERPWCYINGGKKCPGAKVSEDVPDIYWKRCTVADMVPGTPVEPGTPNKVSTKAPVPTKGPKPSKPAASGPPSDTAIPMDKNCKCKVSWVFEGKMYKGCDPNHPEAKRNWCYLNGGAECEGAKPSEDVKGIFWKRCEAGKDEVTTPITDCTCQSTWTFEKKVYKGCDPAHPGAERPWCYVNGVNGGAECVSKGAKPSETVKGMYWKTCTVTDEAPGTPYKPGVPTVVVPKSTAAAQAAPMTSAAVLPAETSGAAPETSGAPAATTGAAAESTAAAEAATSGAPVPSAGAATSAAAPQTSAAAASDAPATSKEPGTSSEDVAVAGNDAWPAWGVKSA